MLIVKDMQGKVHLSNKNRCKILVYLRLCEHLIKISSESDTGSAIIALSPESFSCGLRNHAQLFTYGFKSLVCQYQGREGI